MPKKILSSEQIVKLPGSVIMQSPKLSKELEAALQKKKEEQYMGPTAEEMRDEAQRFRDNWQIERDSIIALARAHAEEILEEAEKRGDELIESRISEAESLKTESESRSAQLRQQAEQEAQVIKNSITQELSELRRQSTQEGYEKGFTEGLQDGKEESTRIIEQLHIVLNKVVERRSDMVNELEVQIINLILAISKKVVKALSEEQRNVVINNVTYALRKLRKKSDVIIRVNLSNLKTISKRLGEIASIAENAENVTVVEDTSIDAGGCVIETDFGEIDARISTQLEAIERNIRQLVPYQTQLRGKKGDIT